MIYRIEIGLKDGVPDARGRGVIHRAEGALKMAIAQCRTRDVYKVAANIDAAKAAVVQETFADPVVAESAIGRLPAPEDFDWMMEIGFKPGVTDNVGRTARGALKDVVGRDLEWEEQVYTSISARICWPTPLSRRSVFFPGKSGSPLSPT
jgi:phosphoribosylformylglycinamidine synthase